MANGIPVEVDGILPERLTGLTTSKIAGLPIHYGRLRVELGQLFDVRQTSQSTDRLIWQGDLSSVHRIGQAMSSGEIEVDSSVGRHAGAQMTGGRLVIRGNTGDFLGVEMSGGQILVDGNAADHVGSAYPGAQSGMNRGSILIRGAVGHGVGQFMRRGTIVVGETAATLTGWNMLAGTILVLGGCGPHVGAGMKRGTIIDCCPSIDPLQDGRLLPTFRPGGCFASLVLSMLQNWLKSQSSQLPWNWGSEIDCLSGRFRTFHGDLLQGGRGELLLGIPSAASTRSWKKGTYAAV